MRDNKNSSFDEASFYFEDPAFEKPCMFPKASHNTHVDLQGRPPRKISLNVRIDTVSPIHYPSTEESKTPETPHHEHNPDTWMNGFVADDDDSSCGTLDYSVNSQEEATVLMVQRALTDAIYGPPTLTHPLYQPLTRPTTITAVAKDYEINQLDLHVPRKREKGDCLFGWLLDFLDAIETQ